MDNNELNTQKQYRDHEQYREEGIKDIPISPIAYKVLAVIKYFVGKVKIGCSGFLYDQWRYNFYPDDLPKSHWLDFYSKHFSTVELNVTFYRLPTRETFSKWYLATPDDFVFSLKGSRFITHIKKLKDCSEPIEAFISRALLLKEKLGIILWQFPPTFHMDLERLKDFLNLLKPYRLRNTFEFRNKTWINKKVFTLLEKENAALCMADYPEFLDKLPMTADFVYIRKHGKEGRYATLYSTGSLKNDAKCIKSCIRQKKEVFVYFNNDAYGYAPKNAAELSTLLKPMKKRKAKRRIDTKTKIKTKTKTKTKIKTKTETKRKKK